MASFSAKKRMMLVKVTLNKERELQLKRDLKPDFASNFGLGLTYNPPIPKMKYNKTFSRLSRCSLYTICIGRNKITKSVTIENTAFVYHASFRL